MSVSCKRLRTDADGFVVPAPRLPKKTALISLCDEIQRLATSCRRCNESLVPPARCSTENCGALIECNCYGTCVGLHGTHDCSAIWCRDHLPRCSKICRIDNCMATVCQEHVWQCAGCGVDVCGRHTVGWEVCDFCPNTFCSLCLVPCSKQNCTNKFCVECGADDGSCGECD